MFHCCYLGLLSRRLYSLEQFLHFMAYLMYFCLFCFFYEMKMEEEKKFFI